MRTRRLLITLGPVVAIMVLIFLIYRCDLIFHSRSTSSNSRVTHKQSSRPTSAPDFSSSRVKELPTGMGHRVASGKSPIAQPVSSEEKSTLYLKLTESPDAAASQLFSECFGLMKQGNYREAEVKLAAYGNSKQLSVEDEFVPYAVWLSAWCMLNQGGSEKKLADAAQVFSLYANTWRNHNEELAKAAWINRALIYIELLRTKSEKYDEYFKGATFSLNLFLEQWPDDPKTSDVRILLNSLNKPKP